MKRIILAIIFNIAFWNSSRGSGIKDSLQYRVYFHTAGTVIEKSYRQNAITLDSLLRHLSHIRQTMNLNKIRITSGASPEGNRRFNQWLSRTRGESLRDFLKKNLALPDSVFMIDDQGENWMELSQMVTRSPLPAQAEILQMLQHCMEPATSKEGNPEKTKLQLKQYQGGKVWRYMNRHFFPELRSSSVVEYEYTTRPVLQADREICGVAWIQDSLTALMPMALPLHSFTETQEKRKRTFCVALKSNLLYDACLIPNIGAELHLGRQWTLSANWQYSWWKNDRKHLYWRIYGGDMGIRKYFGKAASTRLFTGHHLGVYGQILTYDVEWGKRGFIGGIPGGTIWDKAHYGGGIEYGYSKPVGKRLNLDFSLGAGYLGGICYEYLPMDDHYVWQATRKRSWLGPTKAEITLVWLIGNSKINRNMKGGK